MSKSFNKHQLAPRVYQALAELGFKRPTEVQQQVIPYYFQGINMIVEAPTGTGKTAAYGIPMISQLNLQKRSTQALVLAPTRELVLQIEKSLQSYYDGTQLKVGSIVGGKSLSESEKLIRSSPHIVVASPGRLKDVLSKGKLDFFWRDIRQLILDEGD